MWGQFVFIPEDDMVIFENQRSVYTPDDHSFRLISIPFRYWLFNVYNGNVVNIDTSNGTVAEMEEDTANDYDKWYDSIRLNLHLNS